LKEYQLHFFDGNFINGPPLILSISDKILEQRHTAQVGSTPQLVFGINFPTFQLQQRVRISSSFDSFKFPVVEPLYLVVELQQKFDGSIESVLSGTSKDSNRFTVVDYAVLFLGFVHDFRAWLQAGVVPSDAHIGNVFYRFRNSSVSFYWGEFGPATKPYLKETAWLNARSMIHLWIDRLSYRLWTDHFGHPELGLLLSLLDRQRFPIAEIDKITSFSSGILAVEKIFLYLSSSVLSWPHASRRHVLFRLSSAVVSPITDLFNQVTDMKQNLDHLQKENFDLKEQVKDVKRQIHQLERKFRSEGASKGFEA
jgi:hypothetical protein